MVKRLEERRFVGDLPLPATSGGREGHELLLRMGQTCFQPCDLSLGMHGGSNY
jgi:hypothetical protein